MREAVVFRAEFFREDDVYVGLAPELDVSSFGDTLEDARRSLQEAVQGFVEQCKAMGTLGDVLEEAGFQLKQETWLTRQPLAAGLLTEPA